MTLSKLTFHLLMPSHWGLGLRHMNFGGHEHSVHDSNDDDDGNDRDGKSVHGTGWF